jgi:hypothetical protein
VLVEALDQGQRDLVRIVAVEADRDFHVTGLDLNNDFITRARA